MYKILLGSTELPSTFSKIGDGVAAECTSQLHMEILLDWEKLEPSLHSSSIPPGSTCRAIASSPGA